MLLSICIPTYNRCFFLKKNLELLSSIIVNLGIKTDIEVIVIDNCSSDNTQLVVHEEQNNFVYFRYIRNDKNIGIGGNIVKSLEVPSSEYIMLIGDDDYISEDYLKEVIDILKNDRPQMILGNFVGVDENLNILFEPREKTGNTYQAISFQEKIMMALELSNQLSGLVFKKIDINKRLKSILKNTIYPTIYLTMQVALEGKFIHILNNPIKVIQTNTKDWNYDISGCLFEILSGISYLPISRKEKEVLEIQALKRPLISWRLSMSYKHPVQLLSLLVRCDSLEKGFKIYCFLYFIKRLLFRILKFVCLNKLHIGYFISKN